VIEDITTEELDILKKLGVPLWLKVELEGETLLFEAKRAGFQLLKHTVRADGGQPVDTISGGDICIIEGAVRSEPKRCPECVLRALDISSKR